MVSRLSSRSADLQDRLAVQPVLQQFTDRLAGLGPAAAPGDLRGEDAVGDLLGQPGQVGGEAGALAEEKRGDRTVVPPAVADQGAEREALAPGGRVADRDQGLRPGGLLVTPNVPPRSPRSGADGRTNGGAHRVLDPLLRKLWGIQERSFEALAAELKDAGFVRIAAAEAMPPNLPLVRAHRPE
ncbi:hypothetical protein OG943_05165 [Amycolatopsis sp. NBC_00345]|uniref:hypothetical protein n=1 Tax=Amycolatopsis sp. NBC_00345 TaxID=2975955 RepID=UPI002E26DE49